MSEKTFINGLIAKRPKETAPEWVKCDLSMKRKELIDWLNTQQDEWVNAQVCEGKSGKWYAELNTWKPKKS